MAGAVAFILKGYPRLSETFIAQEILGLEQAGLDIRIASLRHPTDRETHPIHGEIAAPVSYLPEYLYQEPARVWRGLLAARRLPGWCAARRAWFRDLRRDPTANRMRRFGQAAVLAAELPDEIRHLHAHFIHTPASVTRYAALMRGLPWSLSAHAKDIWTSPDWELREKLDECRWAVTCSAAAHEHLSARTDRPDGVRLVYHGIDLTRFALPAVRKPSESQDKDGTDAADPVILLTVGRAVEKKGHDILIQALAKLPAELSWRWVHIGGGGLLKTLRKQALDAGIDHRIEWLGSQPQEAVLQRYRDADLFVLANRVAADGDRDGLPNVLLEAQSQALACVASAVSGVPELIRDRVNGRLVPPEDADALVSILVALIADPKRRRMLGEAGRRVIEAKFSCEAGIGQLAAAFAADGLMPGQTVST
ncbi:MAG: glycosyltransferase family 4 protein, partial [Rhodospirillaceae bacterium]|nr:glycosyltransferase family 4 protein [Rhodospirillaceae bacterium]